MEKIAPAATASRASWSGSAAALGACVCGRQSGGGRCAAVSVRGGGAVGGVWRSTAGTHSVRKQDCTPPGHRLPLTIEQCSRVIRPLCYFLIKHHHPPWLSSLGWRWPASADRASGQPSVLRASPHCHLLPLPPLPRRLRRATAGGRCRQRPSQSVPGRRRGPVRRPCCLHGAGTKQRTGWVVTPERHNTGPVCDCLNTHPR